MMLLKRGTCFVLACLLCFGSVVWAEPDFYIPDGLIRIVIPWGGHLNYVFLQSDVEPVNRDGHTMVTLRSLTDVFSGSVTWNADSKTAALNSSRQSILVTIGSAEAIVDGMAKEMPVAAEIIDDRTMVPLRFVAENFGWKVMWESSQWGNNETMQYIWLNRFDYLKHSDVTVDSDNYLIIEEGDSGICTSYLKSTGATSRGIRLGDSMDKVYELYGTPQQIEESEKEEKFWYTVPPVPYTDSIGLMCFTFQNDCVASIEIRAPR